MSVLWTADAAAKATKGKVIGRWEASGLSIDTRTLQPGDLFVPLKDIRDGHEFIPMAYERGAAAVISEHVIIDTPALLVDDALEALENLAKAKANLATRVAVTGSVGKTSVKEMIACICRTAGKTHASIKSYNNHWGVPLTLAGMPVDTEYGVFEMGMNHTGELEHLSAIVKPNIAVITKIAPAHLAHFASIDEIAEAKAEVFSGIAKNGVAIVPHTSPFSDLFKTAAQAVGAQLTTFGSEKGADARIVSSSQSAQGSKSVLNIEGREVALELPIAGTHWVENAVCAILVATKLDIDLEQAVKALKNMNKIPGRGEIHDLNIEGVKVTLIDESYNANPESMRAAIATLGLREGRNIAVLGDMLELGDTEVELHAGLRTHLVDNNIDLVITCGQRMRALHDVLPTNINAGWFESYEHCLKGLLEQIKNNDTIMVKGSNASGMGKLVATLIEKQNGGNT